MTATLAEPQFLEITAAARQLGVSDSLLRKLERDHKIPPAIRTNLGTRLYDEQLIETIRAARTAAAATRQGAA